MIIAGIGSRGTPAPVLDAMEEIGAWCRKHGIWVRSGHAAGADYAFERGARDAVLVYLPFPTFNQEQPVLGWARVVSPAEFPALAAVAEMHHPTWHRLGWRSRAFHTRNVAQVCGLPGEPRSSLVICWTQDGAAVGGTGQALRVADAFAVPVLNMFFEEYSTAPGVADKLRRWL